MRILFYFHLSALILSSISLTFGFFTAFAYWLAQRDLKRKRKESSLRLFSSLEVADQLAFKSLVIGVVLLSFGMVSGIFLAHSLWKQNWVTDQKFVFVTLTWLWYMFVLGLRYFKGTRGIRFLILLSVGYILLTLSFVLSKVWIA